MLPRDFADLTDWQIVHLYLMPEKRRGEERQRHMKGLPAVEPREEKKSEMGPKKPRSREWGVRQLMSAHGFTREQAERDYELYLQRWVKVNGPIRE